MAVRFDAATDRLLRTTDLPNYNGLYTLMAWIRTPASVTSSWEVFAVLNNNGSGLDWIGHGNNGRLDLYVGGDGYGSTLSVNTWYHVTMMRESTTSLRAYLNGVLDITDTTDVGARSANTRMELGAMGTGNGDPFTGRAYAVKVWTTNLTAAEILQEMRTITPQRLANLHLWTPLLAGASERLIDYSGFGRNWTEGGTLTDEDPPPVEWGAPDPKWFEGTVVAGGGPALPVSSLALLGAGI